MGLVPSNNSHPGLQPTPTPREHTPFINQQGQPPSPSTPSPPHNMATAGGTHFNAYDAERAQSPYSSQEKIHEASSSGPHHEHANRPSWDLLGGIKKLEQSYEQFDARNASQAHLIYAEGDTPKNKVIRLLPLRITHHIMTLVDMRPPRRSFCFDGARSLQFFSKFECLHVRAALVLSGCASGNPLLWVGSDTGFGVEATA